MDYTGLVHADGGLCEVLVRASQSRCRYGGWLGCLTWVRVVLRRSYNAISNPFLDLLGICRILYLYISPCDRDSRDIQMCYYSLCER